MPSNMVIDNVPSLLPNLDCVLEHRQGAWLGAKHRDWIQGKELRKGNDFLCVKILNTATSHKQPAVWSIMNHIYHNGVQGSISPPVTRQHLSLRKYVLMLLCCR